MPFTSNTLSKLSAVTSVLVFGMVETHCAQQPKPKTLLVCVQPAVMPRMSKAANGSAQGIDVAVAQRVAQAMGRKLDVHWCASASCSWRCLRGKRCDVVIGQPHQPEMARDVAWSVPYAGSRFGLVVSQGNKVIRSLDDLQGKRVGVVSGTVALSATDHKLARFKTRKGLLGGFHQAKLDGAFLDADFAAWYLHEHPDQKLELVPNYVPRQHWNMAFAVRTSDAKLLVAINKALAQVAESGELKKDFARYGVAFRPPFTNTARSKPAADTWKRIKARGEIVVSVDPANLPYTSAKKDRLGFDMELAHALAKELGLKLRVEWLDVQRDTAIGEVLEGDCDIAFGAAVDPNAVDDEEELAGKVVYSRPYYGTGYVLVVRKKGPRARSLAELKGEKSRRIGAEAGSVADYVLRQRGYLRRLFRNQLAVLKALSDGDIDYGYVWANVGYLLHNSPDFKLELAPGFVPEDRWNIAVVMRKGDDELKRHVDAALEKLVKDGTVAKALARYHVPYFPPLPEKKKADKGSQSSATPARRPAVNRGLEPKFGKVNRSKQAYGGLARIRSAGSLVVGLDHNNLPFSAVRPKPSGLDYEIAGLLAKELGVSLRIYWAYSSHDSYPSKLAKRKLCDVILGVMPDDRFGQRVLYSKPYYYAGYQVVSRDGTTFNKVNEPLAVERGVAVRGLQAKEVQPYPKLGDILEGVVDGKIRAGYVISTRGPWLAHKRWPGKLQFTDGPAVDRFPVCVAVRKSDDDLRQAIDDALERLTKSGRLAKVFARWHIPFEAPKTTKGPVE